MAERPEKIHRSEMVLPPEFSVGCNVRIWTLSFFDDTEIDRSHFLGAKEIVGALKVGQELSLKEVGSLNEQAETKDLANFGVITNMAIKKGVCRIQTKKGFYLIKPEVLAAKKKETIVVPEQKEEEKRIISPNSDIEVFGDLENDGFKILFNNKKNHQDSFAVSADRNTFVICDGMGSCSKSGVIARQLSKIIVEENVKVGDLIINNDKLTEFLLKIKTTEEYRRANEDGRGQNKGHTTLTVAQRQNSGDWFFLVAGDSPCYLITEDEKYVSYGDQTSGEPETGVALGIVGEKTVIDLSGARDFKISKSNLGEKKIILATDWLSDNIFMNSKEYAEKQIKFFENRLSCVVEKGFYFEYDNRGNLRNRHVNDVPKFEKKYQELIKYWKNQVGQRDPREKIADEMIKNLARISDVKSLELFLKKLEENNKLCKPDDLTVIFIDPRRLRAGKK